MKQVTTSLCGLQRTCAASSTSGATSVALFAVAGGFAGSNGCRFAFGSPYMMLYSSVSANRSGSCDTRPNCARSQPMFSVVMSTSSRRICSQRIRSNHVVTTNTTTGVITHRRAMRYRRHETRHAFSHSRSLAATSTTPHTPDPPSDRRSAVADERSSTCHSRWSPRTPRIGQRG